MSDPEHAAVLFEEAQQDVNTRWAFYEYLASRTVEQRQGALR